MRVPLPLPKGWKTAIQACAAVVSTVGISLMLSALVNGPVWGMLGLACLVVGLITGFWRYHQSQAQLLDEIQTLRAGHAPIGERERFLQLLADSLPVRIAYIDKDLRYRFVNRAQCARFGTTAEATLGRTRQEILGEGAGLTIESHVNALLNGEPQQFDVDDVVRGELRHIDSHLVPDFDEHGAVRGFFAVGTDVTERVKTERALRELTSVFESTSDFVIQANRVGLITYMNPAFRKAAGIPSGQNQIPHKLLEFIPKHAQPALRREVWPTLRSKNLWLGRLELQWLGSTPLPVQGLLIAHRNDAGRIERFSAVLRDVTAEVQAQHEASRQAASLRSVAEAIPAAVAVVDADGVYQYVNRAFENWVKLPRHEVVSKKGVELLGEYEFNRRWPWAVRALAGEHVSYRLDYPGREHIQVMAIDYIPLNDANGNTDGFVIVAQDVSAQVREEDRLLQIAEHDPLTGLANRAGFERKINLALATGHGPTLALLYLDLDYFKPVNDQFGHAAGDQVLRLFAKRLLNIVRPSDLVVRLGGDEFAIVLTSVQDRLDAKMIADKVLAAAQEPFHIDGNLISVGASIGVAYGADPALGYQDLMARADAKLFKAKKSGRGRQIGEVLFPGEES